MTDFTSLDDSPEGLTARMKKIEEDIGARRHYWAMIFSSMMQSTPELEAWRGTAQELFDDLIAEEPKPWVQSLAYRHPYYVMIVVATLNEYLAQMESLNRASDSLGLARDMMAFFKSAEIEPLQPRNEASAIDTAATESAA